MHDAGDRGRFVSPAAPLIFDLSLFLPGAEVLGGPANGSEWLWAGPEIYRFFNVKIEQVTLSQGPGLYEDFVKHNR